MNLFRVGGIQLAVHASFVLLPVLVAWEGWSSAGWEGALLGLAMLAAFFTCVVLHELGHAFAASRLGIRVPRILLLPIGGMAEFERIPRKPSEELQIAVAGPLVNVLLVALLSLFITWPQTPLSIVLGLEPDPLGLADHDPALLGVNVFLLTLLLGNVAMATFNMIPVFPMDGGRVLRALLATRLSYLRATWIAALVAKILASLLILLALWQQAWLAALLFTFILIVGNAEYQSVRLAEEREALWRRLLDESLSRDRGEGI